MLITKIASISLSHTGLSKEAASFQARSALTGVGFTTQEAESVTNHPVRRRIVMGLMLVGNAGIITAVATLILTFIDFSDQGTDAWMKIGILVGSMILLFLLATSSTADKLISRFISRLLEKYTDLNVRDYAGLLRLSGEYSIYQLKVEEDDWLVNKTLEELDLRKEGVNVLGITRTDGSYLGVPDKDTEIEEGDIMLIYGKSKHVVELDERRKGVQGDTEHRKSVEEHTSEKKKEEEEDKKHREERRKKKEEEEKKKLKNQKGSSEKSDLAAE